MSRSRGIRRLLQRLVGSPDASEVATTLGQLRHHVDELQRRIDDLTGDDALVQRLRTDVDHLRAAVVEQSRTVDALVADDRPPTR